MYSEKDRRPEILCDWTEQHYDPLAEILLTYVKNPENFPLLEKYWSTPEKIFEDTKNSRNVLSRVLFGAKFYVSDAELHAFLSRLNEHAENLGKIEDDAINNQAMNVYQSRHTTPTAIRFAG